MDKGVGELPPYHKFGYSIEDNKNPDPNSVRSKVKSPNQNGKGKEGPTNISKGG